MNFSLLTRPLLCAAALLLSFHVDARPDAGDIPPDALGNNGDGAAVSVSANRGKVVAVVFWASWCGRCSKELPVLEQFQRKAGKEELEVIAVNYKESRRDYRAVRLQMRDWQMTLTHDPKGQIAERYGVVGIPHLVLIDRTGEIAWVRVGFTDEHVEGLIDQFNELLRDPRPEPIAVAVIGASPGGAP